MIVTLLQHDGSSRMNRLSCAAQFCKGSWPDSTPPTGIIVGFESLGNVSRLKGYEFLGKVQVHRMLRWPSFWIINTSE